MIEIMQNGCSGLCENRHPNLWNNEEKFKILRNLSTLPNKAWVKDQIMWSGK